MGKTAFWEVQRTVWTWCLTWAALKVGDSVQLRLPGRDIGDPYTVTAERLGASAQVTINLPKSALGGDGDKPIAAVVTHGLDTVTSIAQLIIHVDSLPPIFINSDLAPTLVENTPAGQLVFTAAAEDTNANDNANANANTNTNHLQPQGQHRGCQCVWHQPQHRRGDVAG